MTRRNKGSDKRGGSAPVSTRSASGLVGGLKRITSSWRAKTAMAVTLGVGLALGGVIWSAHAQANEPFEIDTVTDHGGDANPGDGVCLTAQGNCSLRAALEEANASPNLDVIRVKAGFEGGVIELSSDTNSDEWMLSPAHPSPDTTDAMQTPGTPVGDSGVPRINLDNGAVYAVYQPVTIDLGHKVSIRPAAGSGPDVALFFLDGENITVTGVDQSWTGQTSFYVGPHAKSVVIDGGADDDGAPLGRAHMEGTGSQRFFVVRGGAAGVTLKNYVVSGYPKAAAGATGWGMVVASTESLPVRGLTITGMKYDVDLSQGGDCGTSGWGCSAAIISTVNTAQWVDDLVVHGNTAANINRLGPVWDGRLIDLRQVRSNHVEISGNIIDKAKVVQGAPLIDFSDASIRQLDILGGNVVSDPETPATQSLLEFGAGVWETIKANNPPKCKPCTLGTGSQKHPSCSSRPPNSVVFCESDSVKFTSPATDIGALTMQDNQFTGVTVTGEAPYEVNGKEGLVEQITDDPTISPGALMGVEMTALVHLPVNTTMGSGVIRHNRFIANGGTYPALYWRGKYGDSASKFPKSSGLVVQDNYFDGWGRFEKAASVRFRGTGWLTFEQNTFGPNTTTQTTTTKEEFSGTNSFANVMMSNHQVGANSEMATWYPYARDEYDSQSAPVMATNCVVPLKIASPVKRNSSWDGLLPEAPLDVDVYWTADNRAEVYLGRYHVLKSDLTSGSGGTKRATLQVPIPTSPTDPAYDTLKDAAGRFLPGAKLPIDDHGQLRGALRLQTIDTKSPVGGVAGVSQYSRVANIAGQCAPVVTMEQAATQADPTMTRDVHFTMTSPMPLDPATVDLSDFSLAGSTAPGARLVSVKLTDDGLTADVVARADDTGVLQVSVPNAGAFTSVSGLASTASTSRDNQVTYTNPLSVAPAKFPVVAGDDQGATYSIRIDPAAPAPTSEVTFTTTMDQAGADHHLQATPASPVIAAHGRGVDVVVTAPAQEVEPGTAASISHTVSSSDPNYDGLVVASASPRLYSTNPVMRIEKTAWVGVTGDNTPDNIRRTGTQVLSGSASHINDGTPVWFIFTVTNTSSDDWATPLTDVHVSDDVLGEVGVIDTIPVGRAVSLVLPTNPVPISANGPAPGGG